MNKNKFLFIIILFLGFVLPFKVFAIEPEYDKKIEGDTNYTVLRGTATRDGGYAVLAKKEESEQTDPDPGNLPDPHVSSVQHSSDDGYDKPPSFDDEEAYDYLYIIKYSKNGVMQWTNRYEVPTPPCNRRKQMREIQSSVQKKGKCQSIDVSPFLGFAELDSGNFIVISNYYRFLISESGILITTYQQDDLYDYMGFRCEAEGEGTACVAIGIDESDRKNNKITGIAFRVKEDGTVYNTYNIPCIPLVKASDGSDSVGIPVSFFRNNDGNYIMQTIEGPLVGVVTFDGQLNKLSYNSTFFIADTKIDFFRRVGSLFWITGQFQNSNYFGGYIKYEGPFAESKTSFVTYDSQLKTVLNEKILATALIDYEGEVTEEGQIAMIRSMMVGAVGLIDGFRDGKYVSTFETDLTIDENSEGRDSIINAGFIRMDSSLNEFDKYHLFSGSERTMDQIGIMYSSIIRLKDGSDVVLLNTLSDGTSNGRHIKFGNHYIVTAVPESVSDVSFEKEAYNPGDIVKVQLRDKSGYYVDKVIVRDADGNVIDYDKDSQTFIMPDSDVTIEVQYRAIEQKNTGILLSILLSLLAIGVIGYSNFKYFKKQKPIGM